jgi:oxygen-dependent protoporphyrinogen oxidase
MPSVIGRAVTADGVDLLTRHWPAADPWAAMLIVHGLGEQSGRYEHVGDAFVAAGIDALSFDLRGHGESGGRRGHVDSFDDFLDDVADLLGLARPEPVATRVVRWGGGLPQYLVGHQDRVDAVRAAVSAVPGLAIAGAAFRGVGVPACIRDAYHAVDALLDAVADATAGPGMGRAPGSLSPQ